MFEIVREFQMESSARHVTMSAAFIWMGLMKYWKERMETESMESMVSLVAIPFPQEQIAQNHSNVPELNHAGSSILRQNHRVKYKDKNPLSRKLCQL